MINDKTFPARLTQYSHPAQVRQWLTKQQDLASHLILVVIDIDRLIIHEAADGKWLARLDWSEEQIVVSEPENIMLPYKFKVFNSALSFLDALLLHYFIKTSETRPKSAALA